MKPENEAASQLRRTLTGLAQPDDYFSGLKLSRALCPDNILLFKRLQTPDFRPGGVIDNLHHRFELLVVLERDGAVMIGDARHRLEPGEAVLIFPNQFHHYLDVEAGAIRWLFITFELAGPDTAGELTALRDLPRKVSPEAMEHLLAITREYTRRKGRPDPLALSYRLAELLRTLVCAPAIPAARRNVHASEQPRDRVLEQINAYVRQNFAEAPTLQRLATELGYSESHLRTLFRDQLGISLGRYIRNSRLAYASQLLQEGRLAIADVARCAGFDSPMVFSRAFKNAYGTTPREYSKRFQNHIHLTNPDKSRS